MVRLVVGVLACLGAGAMTLALADPSSPAPPQPAAASSSTASPPATATPAASAASATLTPAPAKPAVDPEEKRLLAQGYKPEIRNGEKVFCRREDQIGTHLGGIKHCGTVAELKATQTGAREELQNMQRDRSPVVK